MIVGLLPKMFVFVIYAVVNLFERSLSMVIIILNNKTIFHKEATLLTVAKKMLTVTPPQSTICDIHGEKKQPLVCLSAASVWTASARPWLSQTPGALSHIYQNIYPQISFVIRVECPFWWLP